MSASALGPIQTPPADTPMGQASEVDAAGGLQLLLPSASSYSGEVDAIAATWTVFSGFLVALVFGLLATFCVKYLRKGPAVQRIPHKAHSIMEWSWTFALAFIALGISVWAARVYFEMHIPPADATEIYVVGKQWMWKIQHPDGTREIDELHVPVGQPIKLVMSSQDVIHSFYIPAFRTKQDVVPGRYTYLWFTATRPGTYRLFCAEYCGTSHSDMTGMIHVLSQADFAAWKSMQVSHRAIEPGTTLAARGRELFTRHGCISCHRAGGPVPAPDLEGLYMKKEGLRTGETVLADDNYLRESILNPKAKIVKGYDDLMPSFQGQLSEEDLLGLISYIRSLRYSDKAGK